MTRRIFSRELCARRAASLGFCWTVLVLAWACSGKSSKVGEAKDPPSGGAAVEVAPDEVVRLAQQQAQELLTRGEVAARQGEWNDARSFFDEAVDVLLALPGGVEGDPRLSELYANLVASIEQVERRYLAELAEAAAVLEQSEEAAVDSLTSDAEALDEAAVEGAPSPDLVETRPEPFDIPIVENARVLSLVKMYQTERHDWFQEALERAAPYMPMIRQVLKEEGLPQDLVYLAMVESAFKTRAVSRAGARGMWQFIRGTGRLYGLQQDFWIDDRFDPEKATRAAAIHLKDLYEDFGDWYLAMAAYNSGPRRVERAIRRTGSRDFWTLSQKRRLPRETRSYVPLILAATIIGNDPERYGFESVTRPALEFDVVNLDHPVDLATAAKAAGATLDQMKELNPELRRWVTPLDRDDYVLRIPKGRLDLFCEAIDAIPEDERVRFGTHVVRRGDTLSHIAARYGTSVEALLSANRLRRRSLLHPGQVLTVPVPPGAAGRRALSAQPRRIIPQGDQDVYVVQRGDTLGAIATAFSMSLRQLRSINGMSAGATRIYPGQKLLVDGDVIALPRPAPAARRAAPGRPTYLVQPGDTLGQIADAHQISLRELRALNGFSRRKSRIYPGQELIVGDAATPTGVVADAGPVHYRVRRGDTLSKIARRFGVSVESLRRWNQISSDHIVAGESLTIFGGAGAQ